MRSAPTMNTEAVSGAILAAALIALSGCGYSEADMQVQRDQVQRLSRSLDKLEAYTRGCQQTLADLRGDCVALARSCSEK
jgi:hypothetical protein